MDFFQSHQTVPKPLLSYLLPYSRTFNCTSKTTGWFTKGAEIDPNLPHANKVLLKVARILIYIDGLLSVAPNCAQAVAIFLLPYSRTFKLVKRLAGSPKELKLIPTCPTLTKCYSKVAHAFLYTLMDFFQSHQCPSRCYLTFFHIPERSIALVKRLAGSPKGAEIDPNLPHANKVLLQGSTHSYIH
jgi:hypothetical protein